MVKIGIGLFRAGFGAPGRERRRRAGFVLIEVLRDGATANHSVPCGTEYAVIGGKRSGGQVFQKTPPTFLCFCFFFLLQVFLLGIYSHAPSGTMTGREGEGNGKQSEWNGIGKGGIRDRGDMISWLYGG